MTIESGVEILRAWLKSQSLQLCTLTEEPLPIDGLHETLALREIVELAQEDSWDDLVTAEYPAHFPHVAVSADSEASALLERTHFKVAS